MTAVLTLQVHGWYITLI